MLSDDLKARGATAVVQITADASNMALHTELWSQILRAAPELDSALIAYGSLGDQAAGERDFSVAEREIAINFTSAASLLTILGNHLEARGRGQIIVISSVAGDRGRKSNYIYGAAKAALSTFTAGLRHRLAGKGIHVLTIQPGFVDTPMTAHLKKGPLFASSQVVGRAIVRAADRGAMVAYIPWFWYFIMAIIRSIPERIFIRTNI